MTVTNIGLDWPSHSSTGWGLIADGLVRQWTALGIAVEHIPNRPHSRVDFPVFHALGNQIVGGGTGVVGRPDVGLAVFEDVNLTADALSRAMSYDVLVSASQWNHDVLARYGISSTLIHHGIDDSLFQPAPKQRLFGDRLTVFSGGKLEYRKGQDQTIAAFRQLLTTDPDALLVTAWHNAWPELIPGILQSPHISSHPGTTNPRTLADWLDFEGIPARNTICLPAVANSELPRYLHACDVAVFPSRAEGGTNLAAMESASSGIPTVVSECTGHLDLPRECFDHRAWSHDTPNRDGWKETNIRGIYQAMCRPKDCCQLTNWTSARYASNLLALLTTLTEGC